MRTALLDGDAIVWIAAAMSQDPQSCAVAMARKQIRAVQATRGIVCFSDATRRYWRHDLLRSYKARRSEPPAALGVTRAAVCNELLHRELPGFEGDDVMGILATWPELDGETVCVANDKDLLTIPGLHYNPINSDDGIFAVSQRDADYRHLWQTIVGDSTDGYGGAPGVGAKTAGRLLWGDDPVLWWSQVVLAFKRSGGTEQDALLQARLARICRASDYDLQSKRVIPWTPARRSTEALVPQGATS